MDQGKNWLHVVDAGDEGELIARIEDNRFTNFAPIQLEQSRRSNCTFANNWVGNPQPSSLNFSNCEVRAISLDRQCSCDDNKSWLPRLTDRDLSTELYCQLCDRLHACFNATSVHLRRYANEVCGINRTTLQCLDSSTLVWYKGDYYSKEERDQQLRGLSILKISFYFFGGVIFVICIFIFVCCCRKRPADDYCTISSENRRILQANATPKLKKSIKKLTSDKLTRHECMNTITDILGRFKNLPHDVNQVLADHIEQAHQTNKCNGPVQEHDATVPTAPSEQSLQENLYEELLIPNEYSAPSDPLDPNAVNDYSEPFNSASKYGYAESLEPTVPILPDRPARSAY